MAKSNNNVLAIVLIAVLASVFFMGYGMMNIFGRNHVGYSGFGWLFGTIALVATIWVIYDVLVNNKGLSDGMKVIWIICAVIFSIITAVIYYLVGRNNQNDLFRRNRR
ncbi:MAG: PLDc N-terminal domain-containing protein [Nanoarchaeota archaeon]|nr:PLDc N-terminal domain-containing protein [Nanoarchaeota archaeon]